MSFLAAGGGLRFVPDKGKLWCFPSDELHIDELGM
jgi:hypothetical protein